MTFFRFQVLEAALLLRAGPSAQETAMVHWWWERNFSVSVLDPDFHFGFGSANQRVASDAFIYEGWKALKALRRSTPNG